MNKYFAMTVCVLFGVSSTGASRPQSRGWRGIVPLHSTRRDVERILGYGTNKCKCTYDLQGMNVVIRYSVRDCSSGGAWNVPPDTVIGFDLVPKKSPRLMDLKIDETKFKKVFDNHMEGWVYYINEEDGISLTVTEGQVREFQYMPGKEHESLACPPAVWFSPEIPEETRKRLLHRLEQYASYMRTKQFEKLFELYLPEIATKLFPVSDKHEFATWVTRSRLFEEIWIELVPVSVITTEDYRYGTILSASAVVKSSKGGKIIKSQCVTDLVMRNGEWYFVDSFRLGH